MNKKILAIMVVVVLVVAAIAAVLVLTMSNTAAKEGKANFVVKSFAIDKHAVLGKEDGDGKVSARNLKCLAHLSIIGHDDKVCGGEAPVTSSRATRDPRRLFHPQVVVRFGASRPSK